MVQRVLVTGGNSGIGLALCTQLALEHGCHVYLGSRSAAKGEAAVKAIVEKGPEAVGRVVPVTIDIASDSSVTAAAASVKDLLGGDALYAIVNNAGCGLSHGVSAEEMFNTNLYGTKRVVDAFLPLLDPTTGRIVSVGSGAGPMYLKGQGGDARAALTKAGTTWAELEAFVKAERASGKDFEGFPAYGLSKAAVATYSIALAAAHPNILSTTITPGLIDTAITKGMGASKTPEEGTVSLRRCLFEERASLVNGAFYGSDGLRSPLTRGRDPGSPEFTGAEGYA